MTPNIKRRLVNISITISAVLLSVFLAEGAVRLFELWKPKMEIAVPNSQGTDSYRLKANLSLNFPYHGKDVLIETNSFGMRWKNVSLRNTTQKQRIAFLGDSFTFGESADRIEDSFVGVFDRLIADSGFEVLNFGVVGYGYGDMELLIKEVVLPFKPAFIVLVSFNGNDFRDTYLGLKKFQIINGVLELDPRVLRQKIPLHYQRPGTSNESWLSWHNISHDSRLIHRASNVVSRILNSVTYEEKEAGFTISDFFTDFTFWSRIDYPDVANSAKDISIETLTRIRDLCNELGIKLIVVSLPYKEQVYSPTLSGTDLNGVNYDMNLPQIHVEDWANENSVAYLDLLGEMRSHVENTGAKFYPDHDVHINNAGHALVGNLLHKHFMSLISMHSHAESEPPLSE